MSGYAAESRNREAGVAEPGRMAPLSWPPDSGKFRLLAGILLGLSALYGLAYLAFAMAGGWPAGFGDSFALWSWGRFLVEHAPAAIYDRAALRASQLAIGLDPGGSYPFAYPPLFMLVLWPLGQMPGWLSLAALMAVSLPLYLWAGLGPRWRAGALVAALAAPTTAITLVSGQSGFLAAGLLAGGLRLAGSRPCAAGVLLALLAYKPQLGLLVPVALLAGRLWHTLLWTMAAAAVLVLLTALLFGPAVWPAWLIALPAFSRQMAAESSGILHLMPTVLAALLRLGLPPAAAQLAQWLATAAAASAVWVAYRRGSRPLAAPALLVAALLATPYAFVYDMPVLTIAVIWFVAERGRSGMSLGTGEVLAIVLAMLSPATLAAGQARFPFALLSLILLLAVVVRAALRSPQPCPRPARSQPEPVTPCLRAAEFR